MADRLQVAITVSAEGLNPAEYYPCDTYISHWHDAMERHDIPHSYDDLEPGESEYDSELWVRNADEGDEVKIIEGSAILPFATAMSFLDDVGAMFEDCATMGTLGGPLGEWAPDFSFLCESRLVVECIRITPIMDGHGGNEHDWSRLTKLFRNHDTFDLSRMGSAS